MISVVVRDATVEDLDGMARVLHEGFLTAFEHFGGYPKEHVRARPLDVDRSRVAAALQRADTQVIVAEDGSSAERIVAFAAWSKHDGGRAEIKLLYVDPSHHGKGIGTRLLSEIEARLRVAGLMTVNLWTMVWNTQSKSFYERRGFTPTGRTDSKSLSASRDDKGRECPYDIEEYETTL